ncbi:uncharacterized protein [Euphorbia lathyris]|uniref:uncharacterized protein isoform X2 n=1 Tax=Euphorbia lathyris TaxID=212925 RepID=UPI003313342D
MPRASKRKAAPLNSSSVTSSSDSRPGKVKSKEIKQIDSLFDSYANRTSDMIDPEGIEALCSDLKLEYTDVRILILAWKMKAKQQGYFTQEEWRTGLKALQTYSLSKLKKALPELEKEVATEESFKDFYSFAFRYCLTEEKQKSVEIESICELLNIVLRPKFRSMVDSLIEYLKIQSDYKVINLDQWTNFLRFCKEIWTIMMRMKLGL